MIFELDKWIPGLTPENAWIVQVFAVVPKRQAPNAES